MGAIFCDLTKVTFNPKTKRLNFKAVFPPERNKLDSIIQSLDNVQNVCSKTSTTPIKYKLEDNLLSITQVNVTQMRYLLSLNDVFFYCTPEFETSRLELTKAQAAYVLLAMELGKLYVK